ncbi:hypothetical protein EMCRGX_G020977 [Ephydatia muelleri]|eukprot:Em0016g901a
MLSSSSGTASPGSGVSRKITPATSLDGLDKNVWVEFTALAAQTKAVNLGQGFPDFSPPRSLLDALAEVNTRPLAHQYTRSQGHPKLVKALAKLYGTLMHREIDPLKEVIITHGAYTALSHATRAFLNPDDEVVVLEPFFDCYAPMAKIARANVRYVPLRPRGTNPASSGDYVLDPQELRAAFSDKTKIIIINNPNNPLGKVYRREELELIASLCREFDVLCISDEVYEWLVYDGLEHIRMATLPGMWERTLTIGSAGKTFSATGWKTGWVLGPEKLITPLQWVNAASGYTMITPLQEALSEAFDVETDKLGKPDCYFVELPRLLRRKRDEALAVLREVGFNPIVPDGGYFVLADVSKFNMEFDNKDEAYDFQFVKWMTKTKGVAAIPPTAFYSQEHSQLSGKLVRFCFCKDDSTLQAAYKRLREWAQERR